MSNLRFKAIALNAARVLLVCALGLLLTAEGGSRPPFVAQTHYVMGTMLEIQLPAGVDSRDDLFASLFAIARHEDDLFSTFKSNSPVSHFNGHGSGPFAAPEEVIELTSISKQFSEQTEGAFDITVGPLVKCWNGAAERQSWPGADEIDGARHRVG